MSGPTPTLIADAITLTLGRPDRLRSSQIDRDKIDRNRFFSRCRKWAHNENVIALGVGMKLTNGIATESLALQVWVRRKLTRSSLSRPVPKVLRHDAFPNIPTDVIALNALPEVLRRDVAARLGPGTTCSKNGDKAGTGTIACIGIYDDTPYAVTAAHIFQTCRDSGERIQAYGAGTRDAPYSHRSLGRLSKIDFAFEHGARMQPFDAAAFHLKLRAGLGLDPAPYGLPPVRGVRHHRSLRHGEHIALYGGTSGRLMQGRVYLRDGKPLTTANLASFKVKGCIDTRWKTPRPAAGDSGSLAINREGYAIGYLLGGGGRQRFLAPIVPALARLSLQPVWK